jgi:hypothetical protein
MQTLKLSTLSLVIILLIGTTAVRSASADFTLSETKCVGAITVTFCWDGKEAGTNLRELTGEESIEFLQLGKMTLAQTFSGVKIQLICTEGTATGTATQTEPLVKEPKLSIPSISWKGCSLSGAGACKVSSTIATKALTMTPPIFMEETLKPQTGETWFEITFSGEECLFKGFQSLSGQVSCTWTSPEVDLKGHQITCEPSANGLRFTFGEPASLELSLDVTMPTLEASDFWDVTGHKPGTFLRSETKCGEGKFSFCWDETEKGANLRELSGEEALQAAQLEETLLESTFNKGTVKVHVACTEASFEGGLALQAEPLIKEATLQIKSLLLKGCAVSEPTSCKLKVSTIETKPITGSLAGVEEVVLKPESGELFVEISFQGEECLLKGFQPLTGLERCFWVTPEQALKGHNIKCEHGTKGLTFGFGKEAATLETSIHVAMPTVEEVDFWDLAAS